MAVDILFYHGSHSDVASVGCERQCSTSLWKRQSCGRSEGALSGFEGFLLVLLSDEGSLLAGEGLVKRILGRKR